MQRNGDDGVLPRTPRSPCETDGALSFAAATVICGSLAATTYPTTPANPLSYPAYYR